MKNQGEGLCSQTNSGKTQVLLIITSQHSKILSIEAPTKKQQTGHSYFLLTHKLITRIAMLHSVTDFALPYFSHTKFTAFTLLSQYCRHESPKSVAGMKTLCSIAQSHVFRSPGKNLTDLLLWGVLIPFGDFEKIVCSRFRLFLSWERASSILLTHERGAWYPTPRSNILWSRFVAFSISSIHRWASDAL